jgi:hypothetical protein
MPTPYPSASWKRDRNAGSEELRIANANVVAAKEKINGLATASMAVSVFLASAWWSRCMRNPFVVSHFATH